MKICVFLLVFSCFAGVSAKYTGPTNQAGLNLIKEFEGWYPNFYTDPVGIKTIGYGHACHVWDCSVPLNGLYYPPLTQAQGEALLQSDLKNGGYESCVANQVTYSNLNANQYSALVSFVFNLGCGNFQSSTLLRLLNAGDLAGAANEFPKWVYGGGVVLPGLVRRREAERQLFCSSGGCGGGGGGGSCIGSVTADSLYVRSQPSTSSTAVASLFQGDRVTIQSRTTGTSVGGNSYWFKISNGYVSAYYIQITTNSGDSWCSTSGSSGGPCTGTVAADSLYVRSSPSTSATAVASLFKGDAVTIKGRTTGTSVNGNSYWFQLFNGYVSAYYISIASNSGDGWCSKAASLY